MPRKLLLAIAMAASAMILSGCMSMGGGTVVGGVPECDRLIPQELKDDTPAVEKPQSAKLEDGHDDARPWQVGFVGQTGQLEVANLKPRAVDHIYKTCLDNARREREKAKRGFLARLFGG